MEGTDLQSPEKQAPEGTIGVSASLIGEFAFLPLWHKKMHLGYKAWLPFITSSHTAGLLGKRQ